MPGVMNAAPLNEPQTSPMAPTCLPYRMFRPVAASPIGQRWATALEGSELGLCGRRVAAVCQPRRRMEPIATELQRPGHQPGAAEFEVLELMGLVLNRDDPGDDGVRIAGGLGRSASVAATRWAIIRPRAHGRRVGERRAVDGDLVDPGSAEAAKSDEILPCRTEVGGARVAHGLPPYGGNDVARAGVAVIPGMNAAASRSAKPTSP